MEPKGKTGISSPVSLSISILSLKIICNAVVKEILRFQNKSFKILCGLFCYAVLLKVLTYILGFKLNFSANTSSNDYSTV